MTGAVTFLGMEPSDQPHAPTSDAEPAATDQAGSEDPLDRLQGYLDDCPRFPPGYPVVLADREVLLDLLDRLREGLRHPIEDAREIEGQIAGLLADAHGEAEAVIADSERRAEAMVDCHPVTGEARLVAAETIARARRRATEVLRAAGDSATGDLLRISAQAEAMLIQVRGGQLVLERRLSDLKDTGVAKAREA